MQPTEKIQLTEPNFDKACRDVCSLAKKNMERSTDYFGYMIEFSYYNVVAGYDEELHIYAFKVTYTKE